MPLDSELKIRIAKEDIDTFKDRCSDIGVKYTVVLRNMIQNLTQRLSDEQLKFLGEK